ncbi:MAG: glycosyltransferase family 2 protein [Ignavibacteriales bacterium]|nr:glycosyltransferase family 2 protein [Ignavibacteriales bacterium]
MEPLVTVNILSFNRKDDLHVTLTKVYEQDYKNIEVIVVDNNSTDGTVEMVKSEFPNVQLIELKKNIGIAGWNEGFKAARGEYVLVLDDDSYPLNGTINSGVVSLLQDKGIGIVAFKIFNIRLNINETIYLTKQAKSFIGCGALISSQLLSTIGYYSESYFLYYNELDFSARCYDAQFKILYLEESVVIHNQSLKSRGTNVGDPFTSEHHYYYHFISYSTFLINRFSGQYALKYLAKYAMNRFFICIVYGYYKSFFAGLYFCIKNYSALRRKGKRLRTETQNLYQNGNIEFIDRRYFPSFK